MEYLDAEIISSSYYIQNYSTFPLQRHSAYFVRGERREERGERRVAASKNIKGPPPGHLGYFAEEKTFIV